MAPRQVRTDTELCRAPGLWAVGPTQLELPFDARGPNAAIRASGRLKLTPDLDVFAWLCERWLSTRPLDLDGIAGFTLYDLATDLYGRRPNGRDRAALRASLRRLYRVEIAFTGYDSIDARPGAFMSMDRLVERIVSDLDTLDGDARKVGALRGTSFRVVLAPWLRERLTAGAFTYLNWRTLRQLDGLAKRVAVYLAAERFKPTGDGQAATWVGLGRPALSSLGADTYARHRDARAALDRAGQRIVRVDPRYASVKCERRAGGWALVAVRRSRVDADSHAEVRALIAQSLATASTAV